jgi:hypothetical protein
MTAFDEVKEEDFTTIGGAPPPHLKIEQALLQVGGAGKAGADFKAKALKAAGWKYDRMTGYAKNPELAALAFNRIREALAATDDRTQLLEMLNEKVGQVEE